MLFTLGLLLLLTPFPSFQTTTNEKRDATESDMTKPNAVFTPSKPKTTAAAAKQSVHPTLKPNTVNQTVLPTVATNQKPPTVNATGVNKNKPTPAVNQTTPSGAVKATTTSGTITNKDKHTVSVNQTVLAKPPSASEPKASKDKPAATGTPNLNSTTIKSAPAGGAKTIKDKPQPSASQTVSAKSPSTSQPKASKDKPAPTGAPNLQSTSTKSVPASPTKTIKDKPQPSANHTVSVKSPSTSEEKPSKDKPAITGTPNLQSTSTKSAPASGSKTTKDKPQPSVNQTVSVKSPSTSEEKHPTSTKSVPGSGAKIIKDKPQSSANHTVSVKSPSSSEEKPSKDKSALTGTPNLHSTSTKSDPASGSKATKDKPQPSVNQTVSVKSPSTSEEKNPTSTKSVPGSGAKIIKDKPQPSVNQTISAKSPSTSEEKPSKDKPATTVVENVPSTPTKYVPSSGTKTTKNTPTASVNQTTVSKPPLTKSKDEKVVTGPSTPTKTATTGVSSADKDKVTASGNQTTSVKAPSTTSKEKPAPSQPIKVVISDGCDPSHGKEQELKLKPGAPLVMTHKISLLPGGCNGGCETEMAELKGRVARLEKEMFFLREKCPCSANCPNDCSGNGECEKGKCVCNQGFMGPDCSKCARGAECIKNADKGKAKATVETVTLLNKDKDTVQEHTVLEHTLFQKSEQKKVSEDTETDTKPKVTTKTKAGVIKTQTKQEASVKKLIFQSSSKIGRPTVGQVLLKHEKGKQEEVRKGKTVLDVKKVLQKNDPKIVKEGTSGKAYPKTEHLKDEPQTNITQSNGKRINGTTKSVTVLSKVPGTNKTRTGKESLEQSTLAEKNVTQSTKQIKIVKVGTVKVHSVDNKKTDASKTGKGKGTQKSPYIVNATNTARSDDTKVHQGQTRLHGAGVTVRKTGGSGLGSVKAVNISSYSFTVTWSAPQGMFKNFTVIRKEPRAEGDGDEHEEFEEEALEGDKASPVKNTTEFLVHSESSNTTVSSGKAVVSRGKAETKRISMVVPGGVRSVEFSNLRANTHYVLHIYGTTAGRRSKVHRVTATTGPEPATEVVFSNVTESSLAVSWSKPKTTFTGFRITYINIVTGESRFVTVGSKQSHVVLSELSAGSSYIITVTTTRGQAQSDAITSIITTVPAPPTHLQAVNVTDTRAVLQWTPSLGKVDRFILSYESSKTPNVTVTVMLSGNSVEHQLRGLQRGTLYTVKVLSQKDSLQSMAISTTFTTANVIKASEVGARSAMIAWRSTIVYHSYRVVYQVAGEKTKEVVLEPTLTEYKLTGLLPMSHYIVVVQGERDGHYTSVVTTEFITGKVRFPFPTECSQELLNGALQSGEVDIYPQGKEGRAVRVYCDMETDGGGWTVFQRRMNGKTDFYRTWSEYAAGFGNLSEEFWLGNELLHNLTSVGPVSLRVDMRSGNDTAYAHYTSFSVDSEERHYTLTVSGYTGTAGDSMRYHNGRPFSARDKNPDSLGIHCARAYMGGWWYKNCYKTNLNGLYGINSNNQGIVWIDWKGKDSSIPFTEMKFRPSRFSPATHG